jgi:hypothetical protein
MADWINCPGCGLKHSRRPDGMCPRCKQPVEGSAPMATTETAQSSEPPLEMTEDPDPPPASASMAGLGNLAQSARGKELKSARIIMFVVGILSVAVNMFVFSSADAQVQKEIDAEIAKLGPGMEVDQEKVAEIKDQAVGATKLISGGGMVLGMIFVACGLLVYRYPVPATITALALYLASIAIFGMVNPASIASGLIVKFFIVAGLFKSVQAAIAYQKELAAAPGL